MRRKILAHLNTAEKPLTTGNVAKALNADFHEVRRTLLKLYEHNHIEKVMSNGQPFKKDGSRYAKPKGITLEIHWQKNGGAWE